MEKLNLGIVICSRFSSSRIPGKPLRKIEGVSILNHLLAQIKSVSVPTFVAVPLVDEKYFPHASYYGCDDDPLERTLKVANHEKLSHIIRITHDKIFIDTKALREAILLVKARPELDYLYSDKFTAGTGFEIISTRCLEEASGKFKNVEHITYAARLCSKLSVNANLYQDKTTFNLLIDELEDLKLMEVLFSQIEDPNLEKVLTYLRANSKLAYLNRGPVVSVYTCVHNGAEYIARAMRSVQNQKDFSNDIEYLIVDDYSTDGTLEQVAKFSAGKLNVRWFRNQANIGLASSSNFALSRARGKYIVRLDADDFFTDPHALQRMSAFLKLRSLEVVYPAYYYGSVMEEKIRQGDFDHLVGGTLFDRNALNFLRFTDGIRNHDSLDIFVRAKDKLKIGYYDRPLFMYTQREDSMSKINVEERNRVATEILANGGASV